MLDNWVPKEGDIFLTRHAREEDNTSPGFWNHAAIYVGNSPFDNAVVEAQAKPNKVIYTPLDVFLNRYPHILILRITDVTSYPVYVAQEARKLIGSKYRKLASVFRFIRRDFRGHNCVSVVRTAFKRAYHYDPGWKLPDSIMEDVQGYGGKDILKVVGQKG